MQRALTAALTSGGLVTGTMAVAVGGMLLWLTGLVMSWGFLAIALYRARPTA